MNARYTFDSTQIVYEVVADEVILVNLDDGCYYMMDGTAALIWQLLINGASVEEAAQFLAGVYADAAHEIENAIRDLVTALQANSLLLPADAVARWDGAPPQGLPSETGRRFDVPTLTRYTDMANLILMDPISEFDENGWPTRRTPPAT